jgi:sodium/proline symporter
MLCALFWKRTTLSGAISGMFAGGATIFIWKFIVRPLGGAFDIYELLPAFLISLIVIVVVSLIGKKPDEDILREFEEAKG